MKEWEFSMRGSSEAGGSGSKAPASIAGNVCPREREAALAKSERRPCWEATSGLSPQLFSGVKKADVGLRISGEKEVLTVVSIALLDCI